MSVDVFKIDEVALEPEEQRKVAPVLRLVPLAQHSLQVSLLLLPLLLLLLGYHFGSRYVG